MTIWIDINIQTTTCWVKHYLAGIHYLCLPHSQQCQVLREASPGGNYLLQITVIMPARRAAYGFCGLASLQHACHVS